MSMFNDIDWTCKGNSEICFSNSEQVKRLDRGSRWASSVAVVKPDGKWNPTAEDMVEHFKETGHPVLRGISQCVESRSPEKEKLEDVLFTSLRNLRIQGFCFARFTQQISSVSTEQWRVGVKIWLSGFLVKRM